MLNPELGKLDLRILEALWMHRKASARPLSAKVDREAARHKILDEILGTAQPIMAQLAEPGRTKGGDSK